MTIICRHVRYGCRKARDVGKTRLSRREREIQTDRQNTKERK